MLRFHFLPLPIVLGLLILLLIHCFCSGFFLLLQLMDFHFLVFFFLNSLVAFLITAENEFLSGRWPASAATWTSPSARDTAGHRETNCHHHNSDPHNSSHTSRTCLWQGTATSSKLHWEAALFLTLKLKKKKFYCSQ